MDRSSVSSSRHVNAPDSTSSTASDDDDEQTLELKLQAIQAQLRLKKLQKQKARSAAPRVEVATSPHRKPALQVKNDSVARAADSRHAAAASSRRREERKAPGPEARPDNPPIKTPSALRPRSFNERLADVKHADQKSNLKRQVAKSRQSKAFNVNRSAAERSDPEHATSHEPRKSDPTQLDRERHSGVHLSRRFIDSPDVDTAFEEKDIYQIPRLLKEVHAPAYDPPDTAGDFVLLGVIASKSNPQNHANSTTSASSSGASSKFMVLHLTDLKWELDLFLFGGAFETYWKLSVGSVIAVLNPVIMPPKKHMRDSGRFSLKLGSSDEVILELGTAAHLGFCKSIKKDGQPCNAWIDSRRTEYCDFHVNLQVERSRATRMETNSMQGFGLFGPKAVGGGGKGQQDRRRPRFDAAGGRLKAGSPTKTAGFYRDREAHSDAFMVPPELQGGLSAAQLLDGGDLLHHSGATAQEQRRKRYADKEKDRDLARKLGTQSSQTLEPKHSLDSLLKEPGRLRDACAEGIDAKSLGLVGAAGPRLARPGKVADHGVGWSSAFKRGLPSATQGPSPKKARFDLKGKGVRLPGRESLEAAAAAKPAQQDDDDDELDIV